MEKKVRVHDMQTLNYWLIQACQELQIDDIMINQIADIGEWLIDKGVVFPAPYPCNERLCAEIQQYIDDRTMDEL